MDQYLFRKLYEAFRIPVCVCSRREVLFVGKTEPEFLLPCESDPDYFREIWEVADRHRNQPMMYLETFSIYYGMFADAEDRLYLFGPLSRITPDEKETAFYCRQHKLSPGCTFEKKLMAETARVLLLAYYLVTGEHAEPDEIIIAGQGAGQEWSVDRHLEFYQLEKSELNQSHHSYEYEQKLMTMIKNGDVEGIRRETAVTNTLDPDTVGVVAVDSMRRAEYLMVVYITLLSRAAIAGGLNVERSMELSDIYLQRIERCKTIGEYALTGNSAALEYVTLVRKVRQEKSRFLYIEKCKDYIAANLRKPIKVGDIAPAIGVNRSYLTRRFSEVEGITIQTYIMKERCSHAANLLRFSDYSIAIIAEYFCFSSQSHFGRQFKQFYGMTPYEYRLRNKVNFDPRKNKTDA